MPDDEVALIQRILDLLNNDYSNDTIPEGQGIDYLLSTMDKDRTSGFDPSIGSFVGSMDPTAESQARLNAMFGDVLDLDNPDHASFILKSENILDEIEHEIALYTTSDHFAGDLVI